MKKHVSSITSMIKSFKGVEILQYHTVTVQRKLVDANSFIETIQTKLEHFN